MRLALKRTACILLVVLLCSVAWLHFVGRISLTTQDLGRHIRNGELALTGHHIISTNYYAYTYPDFHTVCHHWAAGVLLFLVWKAWGFVGLSSFYGGVLLITFAFFIWTAARSASCRSALTAAALVLPLLAYRIEIRPEGLTTLFLGLNFLLLDSYRRGKLDGRWLWLVPVVHLLWVNVHILFAVGLCLTGIFILDALVREGFSRSFRLLFGVGLASVAASCLNPFGLEGVLQPLNIFNVYGYKLAENQTVFFMMKRFPGRTIYEYFLILLGVAAALWILRVVRERNWRDSFLHLALLVFFGLMAVKAVRAIAMFGLFFIPLAAENWESVVAGYAGRWAGAWRRLTALACGALILMAAVVPSFYLSPLRKYSRLVGDPQYANSLFYVLARPALWAGLEDGVNGSAEFFRGNGLRGPVFNNYDIGGYFIFHLFPGERPFVDNRPEAYPVDFFSKTYGPMQEDDKVWEDISRQYGFEVIYFYRHDMTTWGQPFLIRRLADPRWAPVFVDAWTIILARRGGVNQSVIDRFELPRSMFRSRKN
ncbi:MAG: hypothetical protein HGA80_00685 [Candidatus Omnitrophica bacterium]|nr:hypothetical protein [Candidatus Omnitrophota bacterium]